MLQQTCRIVDSVTIKCIDYMGNEKVYSAITPSWYDHPSSFWLLIGGLLCYGFVLMILRSFSELPPISAPELVEYNRYDEHEKEDDD